MNINSIHTILSLLQLKGIGPAFIGKHELRIKEAIDNNEKLQSIVKALGKDAYTATDFEKAEGRANEIIDLATGLEIRVIDSFDASYPSKLKADGLKWPILFIKGKPVLEQQSIGIIGSREATATGRQIAQRIGAYFFDQRCCIVNGIAKGIDAAGIGKTEVRSKAIGVAPGGLAFSTFKVLSGAYQEEAVKILESGGGLISQYPPDKKQDQYTVVEYCKLQAALSDALILVQGRVGGGSRFTIEAFSRLNRPLGIVNVTKYDKPNADCYSANNLLLDKLGKGISEYCGISKEKIKCSIIKIEEKTDYLKVLESLPNENGRTELFDN